MTIREEMRIRQNKLVAYLDRKYGEGNWGENNETAKDKKVIEHHKWLKSVGFYNPEPGEYRDWHNEELLTDIILNHESFSKFARNFNTTRQNVYAYIKSKPKLQKLKESVKLQEG